MSSRPKFERRIGRRVAVEPIDVTFFVPASGLFRKKVAPHEVPARIENVSITGAAIVAQASLPWNAGDRVVVRSQGIDNVVVVRHRRDTSTDTHFGVELTRSASGLRRQIQQLLDPHLGGRPPTVRAEGPQLGLHRPPGVINPVLPLPKPEPSADDTDAPAGQLHEPGPVMDLEGPEPVLDITDAVMGLEPTIWPPSDSEVAPAPEPAAEIPAEPEPVAEIPAEPEPAIENSTAPEAAPEPAVTASAAPTIEVDDSHPEPTTALDTSPPDGLSEPDGTERAIAPHAPAPTLPHSPGRQILEDVFDLMED